MKPVSIASGSQQRELIDQTLEQDGTWQQVPPAAAAAHKNVSESISIQETTSASTEMLSVNERKRKRQPHHDQNHQANLDLDQDTVQVNMFSRTFYGQIIYYFSTMCAGIRMY